MKQFPFKKQVQVRKDIVPNYYSEWRVLFVISFWGFALPVFVRQRPGRISLVKTSS